VHFREDSFGDNFLSLPESQKIGNLLARSLKGLAVTGITNALVSEKLHSLISEKGLSRWLRWLDILDILADSKDLNYICNNVITGQNPNETARMNKIIGFVIKNFGREILLSEAADIANMAENSFSRYFSQRTRKSFTGFVNEVRLNHASKLLIETPKSITEICMECGFNNLSNFNRQFRKVYQKSPLNFKKLYNG
jgi:AraC-like DNA-binding protein